VKSSNSDPTRDTPFDKFLSNSHDHFRLSANPWRIPAELAIQLITLIRATVAQVVLLAISL
jgi:hypothetical protein